MAWASSGGSGQASEARASHGVPSLAAAATQPLGAIPSNGMTWYQS
jgi:hypothetical protein